MPHLNVQRELAIQSNLLDGSIIGSSLDPMWDAKCISHEASRSTRFLDFLYNGEVCNEILLFFLEQNS